MNYLERIDAYRDEMIKTLKELISIPSVAGEPKESMPFGEGVEKAYQYMLEKGSSFGFRTVDVDHYGGHIEWKGKTNETMALLVHLDVVPEGGNWDYAPYGGEIVDGKMYGRGTLDDKGAAVICLYAMKALKESGIHIDKNVRLILGLDEETGWEGMAKYFEKQPMPDFGLTPDSAFPLTYAEMGILVFELVKKIDKNTAGATGTAIRSIVGGNAANMVADHCTIVLTGGDYTKIRQDIAAFQEETGYAISAKGRGRSLEINVEGVSSHGARPEEGMNAVSIAFAFLSSMITINESMNDFIRFYNEKIAFELDGAALGCYLEDEISGPLILNVGKVQGDDKTVKLTVNVRYPVSYDEKTVYDAIAKTVAAYDIGIVKLEHKPPIHVPKDSEMVKTLMGIYQKHTGDYDCVPMTTGGGTYARAIDNAVAYGILFPWGEAVEHQKNEYIALDDLMLATKIYADAIYHLAGGTEVCYNEEAKTE